MNNYIKTAENLTESVSKNGIKSHLHLPCEISSLAQHPELRVIITILRKRAFSLEVTVGRKVSTPFRFLAAVFIQYRNIIKSDMIHLIISRTGHLPSDLYFPVLLSRILGKKVVVQITEQSLNFIPSFLRKIALKVLVFANAVIVATESLRTTLSENNVSSEIIYPFVDSTSKSERTPTEITPKILAINDNISSKSYIPILKLFKYIKEKYPRAELTLSGCEEKLIELQMYAIENHILSVAFEKSNVKETVKKQIEDNEIIINLSNEKSFPLFLLEAMSQGNIVISEKTKISEEFIEHGATGFLFDENNYTELSEILYQLIESTNLVSNIFSNRKQFEEKFSKTAFIDRWEKIFSRLAL